MESNYIISREDEAYETICDIHRMVENAILARKSVKIRLVISDQPMFPFTGSHAALDHEGT